MMLKWEDLGNFGGDGESAAELFKVEHLGNEMNLSSKTDRVGEKQLNVLQTTTNTLVYDETSMIGCILGVYNQKLLNKRFHLGF